MSDILHQLTLTYISILYFILESAVNQKEKLQLLEALETANCAKYRSIEE